MGKLNKIIRIIFLVVVGGICLYFIYQQLLLGLNRYHDLDETAHLHWAYNIYSGQWPYRDFLYIFTPFYAYLLAPLLLFTGKTLAFFLVARGISFVVFCLAALMIFLIAKKSRDLVFALFTLLVFLYLPLPRDKWIEVRPDGAGVLFALTGIYLLLLGMGDKYKKRNYFFYAGFFLSLGTIINPKTLFYPLVAIIGSIVSQLLLKFKINYKSIIIGSIIPVLMLVTMMVLSGNFEKSFYSIFILHQQAGKLLSQRFIMQPNLFFNPNSTYYGAPGFNFNYIANLLIYLLASLAAIKGLIGFLRTEDRFKNSLSLILSLLFFANLAAYIYVFPLKHIQYLMMLSPFVAYFFADFVFSLKNLLPKKISENLFLFLLIVLSLVIGCEGRLLNKTKISWYITELVNIQRDAKANFADNEYVFDLTGASLFYRDPYYICCLPYGDYSEVLTMSLPNLERELWNKNAGHVFIQFKGRINTLPALQQEVIKRYYLPIPGTEAVMAAGQVADFTDKIKTKEIDLIAQGNYSVYLDGQIATIPQLTDNIKLDGNALNANPVNLRQGKHRLNVAGNINQVKLLYQNK